MWSLDFAQLVSETQVGSVDCLKHGDLIRGTGCNAVSSKDNPVVYYAYVDNIGLNGLLIVEEASEREFYITADAVTGETTRRFHLKAAPEGGILSTPVLLKVRKK